MEQQKNINAIILILLWESYQGRKWMEKEICPQKHRKYGDSDESLTWVHLYQQCNPLVNLGGAVSVEQEETGGHLWAKNWDLQKSWGEKLYDWFFFIYFSSWGGVA